MKYPGFIRHASTFDSARDVEVGDKVTLNVTAYVRHIDHENGTVELATTREPFADPIVLDECHPSRLTFREAGPAEPCIGDTITGKQVRETAWRRGTTLLEVTVGSKSEGATFVLLGDGKWISVTLDDPAAFPFDGFLDSDRFEVVTAPGKPKRPAMPPTMPQFADVAKNIQRAFDAMPPLPRRNPFGLRIY